MCTTDTCNASSVILSFRSCDFRDTCIFCDMHSKEPILHVRQAFPAAMPILGGFICFQMFL